MEPKDSPRELSSEHEDAALRRKWIEDACGCVRNRLDGRYAQVCRAHAPLKLTPECAELMRDAEEVPYRG